ncbi:MAG: histidine phosphatase family protein [Bacilli bacterium]|nr:histidine phosphatase family protein [Bacilli bacterium]
MTTVYLIRHSVRMKNNLIESYNTHQDKTIQNEKVILSVLGERRAEILANEEELQNIDVVYTSSSVRTLETAKYLIEKQNLKVNIDERLNERVAGIPNENEVVDWKKQYEDPTYKTTNGESQLDVRKRFEESFNEIIKNNKDKRIAIFSHGYAITFFLLKYCKLLPFKDDKLNYEYNGKILFNKTINAPEVFKMIIDGDNVIDIELIEFADLPFEFGV